MALITVNALRAAPAAPGLGAEIAGIDLRAITDDDFAIITCTAPAQ